MSVVAYHDIMVGMTLNERIGMALLDNPQGCKVGWAIYDNEAEARARAATEAKSRERKFAEGYDFGYQWPGAIEHLPAHPTYGDCWRVVTT